LDVTVSGRLSERTLRRLAFLKSVLYTQLMAMFQQKSDGCCNRLSRKVVERGQGLGRRSGRHRGAQQEDGGEQLQ
jgi:hypothetical protein